MKMHDRSSVIVQVLESFALNRVLFLIGAFPLREKCPTIAVTVFSRRFSIKGKMPDYSSDCFFFLQTTITDRSTFQKQS